MEENPKEKANLILACMDRRLNEAIEARAKNTLANTGIKTIVLRNAGGDIDNMRDSIKEIFSNYDVADARVAVHNDCGAMNDIAQRKKGTGERDAQRDETAAKYLKSSWEDLCKENMDVQGKSLRELVNSLNPNTKVAADNLYVTQSHSSNADKKGAIILDTFERPHTNYSELAAALNMPASDIYFIQYTGKDNIIPDISLLPKALGIKDITLFSTEKTLAKASVLVNEINKQEFAVGLHVKLVELVQQPALQHKMKLRG